MLRAISARAGGDPGYPGLSGPNELPPAAQPRRLALLEGPGWPEVAPEARVAFAEAVAKLKAAGVEILTRAGTKALAEVETAIADVNRLSRSINNWEFRWPGNTLRDKPGLSRAMIDRVAQAEAMTLEEFQELLIERTRIRGVYARLAEHCDAIATLPAIGPAPVGLGSTGNPLCAVPGSLLGVPALSLPHLAVDGLPLGLQIMGFEQKDAAAVAIAAWVDGTLAKG
jgi:Asp-tRNA(Asn)/Glu-tRNA(Gln) amidotransferase A subunit family amidase